MIKLYGAIALIAILGGVGYGAKYYYDTTQNTIAMLRDNNAKLEVANQTNQETIKKMGEDTVKLGELNNTLSSNLQKAEQYGDSLRDKLQQLNLVKDALTDAKDLEGRMNGATAKIWREITTDTGGDGGRPIPNWLQQSKAASGSKDSNQDRKSNDTDGSTTEASTTE